MSPEREYRAPLLRGAIAAVASIDLISFVYFLAAARAAALAHGAPMDAFATVVSPLPVSLAIAATGVAAAVAFARAPGRLGAGTATLLALALLSTAHAQLFGSPWRHLFYSGLCLAGWLAGLIVARRRGVAGDESYARTGALALLGTAYLNAGLSKLVFGGTDWATSTPIQAVIIGQDGLIGSGLLHSYRMWVVDTPAIAAAFSIATVLLELAGPLMLVGRRTRLLVAGGLIAMHINILLVTGIILYWEAMFFLALFALNPDDSVPSAVDAAMRSPFAGRAFAPLAAVLALAAAAAIVHQATRFVAADRDRGGVQTAHRPQGPPPLRRLGPFAVGAPLSTGWSIERLERRGAGFTVTLSGAAGRARFDLTCAASADNSPFDLGPAHIFYSRDVPFAALAEAGATLRDKVRAAAGEQNVCAAIDAWCAAATP